MTEPSALANALESLQSRVGQEMHLSDWLEITQSQIDAFAAATGDHQWIHVDPERAARESPWRSTIAHGYLTLSLYPALRGLVDESRPFLPGVQRMINYGLDKVRFPNAVKSGSRVRARCILLRVETVPGGRRSRSSSPSKSKARRSRAALPKQSCVLISNKTAHGRRICPMIYDSILGTIGRTPIVRINRLAPSHVDDVREVRVLQSAGVGQGPPRDRDHRGRRAHAAR